MLSIVVSRLLKPAKIRKSKTVTIRVRNGRTMHSLQGVDVAVWLGKEQVAQHSKVFDTHALEIFIRTDFRRRTSHVKLLSLQRPYALHCNFVGGLFSVYLHLLERKETVLRFVTHTHGTENYQPGNQSWRTDCPPCR